MIFMAKAMLSGLRRGSKATNIDSLGAPTTSVRRTPSSSSRLQSAGSSGACCRPPNVAYKALWT